VLQLLIQNKLLQTRCDQPVFHVEHFGVCPSGMLGCLGSAARKSRHEFGRGLRTARLVIQGEVRPVVAEFE
jgi:hypothetical protein